jgi:hypothetical protein
VRNAICVAALTIAASVMAGYHLRGAAEQTWAAMISDSSCKEDHGGEIDPKECTAKCVGNGDKYVLMVDGYTKALPIANQDFPDLAAHAGQIVKATGELTGGAVVLRKLE